MGQVKSFKIRDKEISNLKRKEKERSRASFTFILGFKKRIQLLALKKKLKEEHKVSFFLKKQ